MEKELNSNKELFLNGYNKFANENNNKLNKWWSKLAKIKYMKEISEEDFTASIDGSKIKVAVTRNDMLEFLIKYQRSMIIFLWSQNLCSYILWAGQIIGPENTSEN